MSDPRYRPRDCAENPAGFGRGDILRWKSVADIESEWAESNLRLQERPNLAAALLRAARYQHDYVLRIRSRLKSQGFSIKAYASAANLKYDRVVRVLRGSAILRLEDLAMADEILGQISEFAIADAAKAKAESDASAKHDERIRREYRAGLLHGERDRQ